MTSYTYRNAKGRRAVGVRKTHRLFKYGRRIHIQIFSTVRIMPTSEMTTFRSAKDVEAFFGTSKEEEQRAHNYFLGELQCDACL